MTATVALQAGELTLRLDLDAGARVIGATCAAHPELALLDHWWCGYEADGRRWSDVPRAGERAFGLAPARVREVHTDSCIGMEVSAQTSAPHLRVAKRFTVYRDLPFVRVRYRIEATGVEGRGPGLSVALPALAFAEALADPFDLPEDTADDGIDLGNGLARPAWRSCSDRVAGRSRSRSAATCAAATTSPPASPAG